MKQLSINFDNQNHSDSSHYNPKFSLHDHMIKAELTDREESCKTSLELSHIFETSQEKARLSMASAHLEEENTFDAINTVVDKINNKTALSDKEIDFLLNDCWIHPVYKSIYI